MVNGTSSKAIAAAILAQAVAFDSGDIDLRQFIDALEALIPDLPDFHFEAKQTIEDLNADMETIYAVAASENQTELSAAQAEEIYRRVSQLRELAALIAQPN